MSTRRVLKIFAVFCVTVLLVVFSLQQNGDMDFNHHSKESTGFPSSKENRTHVLISLVNLHQNLAIFRNFRVCLTSICKHTSVDIALHVVTGARSRGNTAKVVEGLKNDLCRDKINVEYHDIGGGVRALEPFVDVFKSVFGGNPGSYFSGALFFLSIISHILFPNISKLIILDADLKFRTDIQKLWEKFEEFSSSSLIGIAQEQQPVYRHIMHQYRRSYPETRFGAPLSENGNPGFNSGVLLMHLARIRECSLYQDFLTNSTRIRQLSKKYFFKGHLGDQGFYTLLSFEHPEFFYVLPCTWNRQLCTWWRDNGYERVFHQYHGCEGYVNVYHGNCGTAIPND